MRSSRTIAERRRLRRRATFAGFVLLGVAVILPSLISASGRDVPTWLMVVAALAVIVVTAGFGYEAYQDGRSRGQAGARALMSGLGGVISGWLSSGV